MMGVIFLIVSPDDPSQTQQGTVGLDYEVMHSYCSQNHHHYENMSTMINVSVVGVIIEK